MTKGGHCQWICQKLKKFVDFYEIYELVANGEETISGIRDALRLEKGLSGGNLQRRIEYLSSDPPFLMVNQDRVKFEKESFAGIFDGTDRGTEVRRQVYSVAKRKTRKYREKVRRELERKVLVASTIEVGPEEKMSDGLFWLTRSITLMWMRVWQSMVGNWILFMKNWNQMTRKRRDSIRVGN